MRPRSLVRHGALAAVLALLALAVLRPGLAPSDARGMGPLPACRYDDILTAPRGYDDWATTLVDTILRVPKSYVPPDLVSVSTAGIAGHGMVRSLLIDDLSAMADAASAAGNPIGVESAYRSYDDQVATFARWVKVYGYNGALKLSARPGHSEHQLGLAIDFRSDPPVATLNTSWAKTPAGKWMGLHAWEYGFIRSYPAKKQDLSCYASEPWHYRYLGRDLAAAIHSSGLTTREYLWANYTTAVVPAVTPKPTKGSGSSPAAPASGTIEPSSSLPGGAISSDAASAPSTDGTATGASTPTLGVPGQTLPSTEPSQAANLDPGLAAGLVVGLVAIAALTVLVLRRGRSGVGL